MTVKQHLARFRRKHLPKGVVIGVAKDQSKATRGQFMMEVTIKRWYLPLFIGKGLRQAGVPLYFWPYLFYRIYAKKAVN